MRRVIVVTEVTIPNRKERCVAGFDPENGTMVRPEPEPGAFWPYICCGEGTTFHPGHVVELEGGPAGTALPHGSEDFVVSKEPRRIAQLSDADFHEILAGSLACSPEAVFSDKLKFHGKKAYTAAGAECGSLAAIEVAGDELLLREGAFEDKSSLLARFTLGHRELDLKVGAKGLKQPFQQDGLEAARAVLDGAKSLHIRLGLARPFEDIPDRCYLQINGIYPI